MCLIAYSPDGELIERRVFDYARQTNPDGIGIMSALGVEKFLGRKSGKRAWRYLRRLAADGVPYGLHFRWATHGDVTRENCHPFAAPQSDAVVMHNGVLRQTASKATAARSDTVLFVEEFMQAIPAPDAPGHAGFFDRLGSFMGRDNKMLVFHRWSQEFTICNEDEGEWIDGLWYSNNYSLPDDMAPWRRNWRDMVPDYPLNGMSDYDDRNVSDAIGRPEMGYYESLEASDGYFDDGAALGARAAERALDEREYLRRLKSYATGPVWSMDLNMPKGNKP